MLTDELINELEQVTQEWLVLSEYNAAAISLLVASAKLRKSPPQLNELNVDFDDKTSRVKELRTRMLMLQDQCLQTFRGKTISIPHTRGVALGEMTVESGRISFKDPMDYVTFFRLVKAEQDA